MKSKSIYPYVIFIQRYLPSNIYDLLKDRSKKNKIIEIVRKEIFSNKESFRITNQNNRKQIVKNIIDKLVDHKLIPPNV